MNSNEITGKIIGSAIEVYKILGPGLLESCYEECLEYELLNSGLIVMRQVPVPIHYKEIHLELGYRMDLLVENEIVVELKVVDEIIPLHEAQVLTYLKFSKKKTGLLINFNVLLLKDGIRRFKM